MLALILIIYLVASMMYIISYSILHYKKLNFGHIIIIISVISISLYILDEAVKELNFN